MEKNKRDEKKERKRKRNRQRQTWKMEKNGKIIDGENKRDGEKDGEK